MKKVLLLITCFPMLTLAGWFGENIEDRQIQTVVGDVKTSLIKFNTDNVEDIGKIINCNIKILDKLIKTINESKDYEKVFPKIVSSVEDLAENYRIIADMKEEIRATLDKRVSQVETQRKNTKEKIDFINKKINKTRLDISNEKVDYRKTALQTTLRFQEQERDVWQRFGTGMQFTDLINKLREASGGINKFIDILQVNAAVYEQAAITLKAIQSYKNASKDLQEVLQVVDLGNELIASWDKLAIVIDGAMDRIETIETFDFNAPIGEEKKEDEVKKNDYIEVPMDKKPEIILDTNPKTEGN